jgi:predicted ArsR family transcriptional regulator
MSEMGDDLSVVSLLDDPVRRRLYDWVVGQARPAGREEAAKALGITRALAAFHLDKLAAAGLLEADYRRLTGRVGPGAGRPARVYWRSSRDFNVTLPAREYQRAAEIFANALERLDESTVKPTLEAAAAELGAAAGAEPVRGTPRRRLLGALESAGYEPHADEDGTIRLRNCPFDALVDAHRPLVCGTNLAFARGLTSSAGATELQPVLDPQPGYCCVAFTPDGDTRPRPLAGEA